MSSHTRNRRLLAELLSTRSEVDAASESLLRLADALESDGFQLTRWTIEGPGPSGVRIEFQHPRHSLSASLSELDACARRLAAGHATPWTELLLPEGDRKRSPGGESGRTRGMHLGSPLRKP